jgi:hypothetical protein
MAGASPALKAANKRVEKYYPSEHLKKQLNEYSLQTGEYKSELAVRLLKEFFKARKQGK